MDIPDYYNSNGQFEGVDMGKCMYDLDSKTIVNIGELIEPYFTLIGDFLIGNQMNQFTCEVDDLINNDYVSKLNGHFNTIRNQGGIYFFRIITSDGFDVKKFKESWNKSRGAIEGKKPKANTDYNGKGILETTLDSDEYALYVGSNLTIGSRIKQHFWTCDTAKTTHSLRLNCNPKNILKHVSEIKVNYILFDGLSYDKKKETPLHNLCRYFESKIREKYQALLGK